MRISSLIFTITNESISTKGMGVISTPEVSLSYNHHRSTLYIICVRHYTSNTPPQTHGDHTPRVWTEESHIEPESVAWSTSLQGAARKEQNVELECLGHTDHAERMHPLLYVWRESVLLDLE